MIIKWELKMSLSQKIKTVMFSFVFLCEYFVSFVIKPDRMNHKGTQRMYNKGSF